MESTATHDALVVHRVGQRVAFRLAGWGDSSSDSGEIVAVVDGSVVVDDGSELIVVDARPWPIGNLLPF